MFIDFNTLADAINAIGQGVYIIQHLYWRKPLLCCINNEHKSEILFLLLTKIKKRSCEDTA